MDMVLLVVIVAALAVCRYWPFKKSPDTVQKASSGAFDRVKTTIYIRYVICDNFVIILLWCYLFSRRGRKLSLLPRAKNSAGHGTTSQRLSGEIRRHSCHKK
ncbi:hypothetical protein [Raoultella ornithinolytica]|uniref:hypothetical protein n=1 Tax=Raoultella ornithinolytica TaxID=54291 RepID=UPI0033093BF2|nr:hypothetical protein [Raoultella ornithinolytica]